MNRHLLTFFDSEDRFSRKPTFWKPQPNLQMGTSPELSELREKGWQGWEVVASIPITFGGALLNFGNDDGSSNAGGFGGQVVGARLILRLPVTRDYLAEEKDLVSSYLDSEFPRQGRM